MNHPLKVLILEDVEADAELMAHELKNAGFLPDWIRVDTENSYLTALASGPDLILSDYNGLKFHGPQPPLIHISAKQEGTNWIFSFQDNGIGIDSQYFEKIFVIFQRLHGRDKYSGTGIGLTIAKKIVERHGGQIWVESVKESGTAFYFTVPCNT